VSLVRFRCTLPVPGGLYFQFFVLFLALKRVVAAFLFPKCQAPGFLGGLVWEDEVFFAGGAGAPFLEVPRMDVMLWSYFF